MSRISLFCWRRNGKYPLFFAESEGERILSCAVVNFYVRIRVFEHSLPPNTKKRLESTSTQVWWQAIKQQIREEEKSNFTPWSKFSFCRPLLFFFHGPLDHKKSYLSVLMGEQPDFSNNQNNT
eukprot:c33582_g1_i1.p1 GENE.c33582_g1_i1~~c33582_g1_i1.p1  ORF type:complete len:123 (-),score=15.61 c33582_g1_i1:20-388(-)